MSYILDALKKSERERQLGNVPSLSDDHAGKSRPLSILIWLFAAIITINVIAIAWYYVLYAPRHSDTLVVQLPSGQSPAYDAVATQTPSASAPSPFSSLVSSVPSVPETNDSTESRMVVGVGSPGVPGDTMSLDAARATGGDLRYSNSKPAKMQAMPTPGVREAKTYSVGDDDLPLLEQMPVNVQSATLPVNVEIHVFDEVSTKRFVFVNGKRYREGQEFRPGVVLKEIEQSALVFGYQEFIYRYLVHY